MFKKNRDHLQRSLFGIENQLSASKLKKLQESKEYHFYRLIFCNIREEAFRSLYSEKGSRPNAPVNVLVSSIILLNQKGWTTEELFTNIDFNILTRAALGLDTLEETPFCPATYFNFQNRLLNHFNETGENLIEQVFDNLTSDQLKALKIKTNIQRTDSFMAMSNIRNYSRVQLLIEMLIRLEKILSKEDKEKFTEILSPYIKESSGQYIYKLERESIPQELEQLGKIYYELYTSLQEKYGNREIFRIFERVYEEHFTMAGGKVEVKASEEISSGSLQSPDDVDATYRKKKGKASKGQSVTVTETCNPKNEINLLTDITVSPNNTDDSKILNKRVDRIKEKTPDLEELHTDGAYGSCENDEKMKELEINQIQTGVRGRKAKVEMKIEKISEDEYIVSCPKQKVKTEPTRKGNKACFDINVCANCELKKECPAQIQNAQRTYYFQYITYLSKKRNNYIDSLPPDRKKLRSNVEATIKEFTKPFNHKGKLKVRGKFKTMLYAFCMAISINFGRIYRYVIKNNGGTTLISAIYRYLKNLLSNFLHFLFFHIFHNKIFVNQIKTSILK